MFLTTIHVRTVHTYILFTAVVVSITLLYVIQYYSKSAWHSVFKLTSMHYALYRNIISIRVTVFYCKEILLLEGIDSSLATI